MTRPDRYLYAHANPASLVDPDGHAALPACDTDRYDFCHPVSIPSCVKDGW